MGLLCGDVPVLVRNEPGRRTTAIAIGLGFGGRHDRRGTAHMLEHLLMAAPLGDGPSLSERIERLGGECNATTAPGSLVLHARVLTEDAAQIAALMCQALLRPALSQAALDAERRVVLQELAAATADPADTVQETFLAELFHGHPLGSAVGGTPEGIESLTVETVRDAHARALSTHPLSVSCVGGLTAETLLPALEEAGLADLRRTGTAADPQPAPGPVSPTAPAHWPTEFCWLMVGGRAPRADDPDSPAYTVLSHLLGSSPASLLYDQLRNERGLAYSFHTWSRSYKDSGAWRMLVGCEPVNAPEVLDIIRQLLRTVAEDGPRDSDLASAVRLAGFEVVTMAEDPLEHATKLVEWQTLTGRPWDPAAELEALRQVRADQVAAAAAELSDGLVAVVRPEAS
ncbi:M16 family metallopeptidase [Streptomyces inhibens]|uniref:M16 family metallopeptidase n=1 Tax=Streptomyces inhibens TaxID=2293571 RepID=UPI00402A6561